MTATLLAFMQSRAKEGLATSHRLAQCASPSHAAEIQLDFARTTVQAYADQIDQLTGTMRQVLNDACVPFERRIKTVVQTAADSIAA